VVLLASARVLLEPVRTVIMLAAMDIVCIEDLRVETVIGAYAWERELRQPLLLGLRLGYDNRAVTALSGALDYASVVQALREHVAARTDQLLETLAESCCALLAERFHPRSIELRIDKPMAAAALGCARVGVCVQRDYA
jgi:dihydroneopterin aldolase